MDPLSFVLGCGVIASVIYIGNFAVTKYTHKDLMYDMASNSFDTVDQKSDAQIYLDNDKEPTLPLVPTTPVASQVEQLLKIEDQFYAQPPGFNDTDGFYVQFGREYDPVNVDS
jgi:hypothetical protein